MPQPPRSRSRAAFCAALAALSTIIPTRILAQGSNSWKAQDAANVNWSNQSNWTDTGISNGRIAVFSNASARVFNSTNDIVGLTVAGLTVNGNNTVANPVTIGGNSFGIGANGIDMSAAATDLMVNTAGLTLTAAQKWTVAAGRTATTNAPVSGSGSPSLGLGGAGTVRLNAGATGLGGIQLSAGTLLLGSSTASVGSGAVTVSGTGTLAGVGAIVPNVGTEATNLVKFGAGTTLSPGVAGVGTLTVSSSAIHGTAELDGGSIFAMDLGSAIPRPASGIANINTNDQLVVNGIVNFSAASSNVTVAVNGNGQTFTPGLTYDFELASGSDGLSGFNPGQFTITHTNFTYPGTFSIESINSAVYLTYSPVPEPTHVILACAATTAMGWWVRFWRRRWHSECLSSTK